MLWDVAKAVSDVQFIFPNKAIQKHCSENQDQSEIRLHFPASETIRKLAQLILFTHIHLHFHYLILLLKSGISTFSLIGKSLTYLLFKIDLNPILQWII